jgi:Tol biopolymer transport system component/DNA-binding winged helix-turn-helix (wHTH) protein
MKGVRNRCYGFDEVEIDVSNLRLTVSSSVRPLEPKSFRLLLFLVENPNRVLGKYELMSAVWGDTSVSDNSLARAVTQIRKALDDDPKTPRYIETVPSVGYRFLVDCTGIPQEENAPPVDPKPERKFPVRAHRRWWFWIFAAVGILLLTVGLWLLKRGPSALPQQRLVHGTAYAGWERTPSFSPDGRQIAFYWDGEKGSNPGIYVKLLGEANPLRLTTGKDGYPVWSPDGKRIAFVRDVAFGDVPTAGKPPTGHGIYTVSSLGGPERKILDLEASGISWSPDGKWLALARPGDLGSAIFVASAEGGEARRITNPPRPAFDTTPAFSADGNRLAWSGCRVQFSCDIYVQEFGKDGAVRGSPHQVTRQSAEIYGITWERDGRSLVYSAAHTIRTPYLWRTAADGRHSPQRLEIAGPMAYFPSASPVENRLVFEKSLVDMDIWRYRAGAGLEPLITSSLMDFTPQYSPDGTRIAFCSNRAGEGTEIWVSQADGSAPVQLTNGPGRNQGSPAWSPDGRSIAFDSQGSDGIFSIYTVETGGSPARKITSEQWSTNMPFWWPDGKWIGFRGKSGQIWRASSQGGRAEPVTTNGGSVGRVSPDGATLFYKKVTPPNFSESHEIFARPLAGGEERQVASSFTRDFIPTADGIYYFGPPDEQRLTPLMFYEFSTGASRVVVAISGRVGEGLSVSPDRKSVLFTRSVNNGSDLMIIEN